MAALALITANSFRPWSKLGSDTRPFYVRCSAVNHEKWPSIYDLTMFVSRKKRCVVLFMILIKQFRFENKTTFQLFLAPINLLLTRKCIYFAINANETWRVKKSVKMGHIFQNLNKQKQKKINFKSILYTI